MGGPTEGPGHSPGTVPAHAADAAPAPGSLPANEQLEDLQLQNAVLRRSLAMLQQSVVEGMKGNRGQYQGHGFFKQRGGGPPPVSAAGPGGSGAPEQEAADLEEL